ncbi:unnamed protein product [Prorocentrum cordatum]|uniref:Uncharacterized protein n=1 Tax=Prorocentrum cordatum TaxID=2364126 RepID=A0ABN9U0I0_9DINO|nr:unnamed protein product [Polarella glacialis]
MATDWEDAEILAQGFRLEVRVSPGVRHDSKQNFPLCPLPSLRLSGLAARPWLLRMMATRDGLVPLSGSCSNSIGSTVHFMKWTGSMLTVDQPMNFNYSSSNNAEGNFLISQEPQLSPTNL